MLPNNMDAREVTMHYKCKGDRVDEVLHEVVLNHVNRLEQENKRLREALDASEKHLMVTERHLRDFKKFEFEERTEKERLREALLQIQNSDAWEIDGAINGRDCWDRCIEIADKALVGDSDAM